MEKITISLDRNLIRREPDAAVIKTTSESMESPMSEADFYRPAVRLLLSMLNQ